MVSLTSRDLQHQFHLSHFIRAPSGHVAFELKRIVRAHEVHISILLARIRGRSSKASWGLPEVSRWPLQEMGNPKDTGLREHEQIRGIQKWNSLSLSALLTYAAIDTLRVF